ncbi:synaptotagmin-13 [Spea bombifrons]|uniref:synaptotagmin-13 n=1 Tax=Spea bombifrons TaxID=233779 RepID=UPI00234C001C|nr:synaptotagmin-13 [Spea bombifrons]
MISAPLIAMGATLGVAAAFFAFCGSICVCSCYKKKKKMSSDSEGGTPVTMASVLQQGHPMSVYKCTEPVHPQAKLNFPHIYGSRQTSPEIVNDKDYALKMIENDEQAKDGSPENRSVETTSGVSGLDDNPPVPENEDLEKPPSFPHVPKMRYSLGYERQTEELCVSFLEAVGSTLPGEEDSGSHCYVLGTLTTCHGQTEAQTALMKRSPHTVWEEALLFPLKVEDRAEGTLTLTLRVCDSFSRHQVAGEITLSLANVGIPFGTARWVDLKVPEKDANSAGEVLLSVSYLPAANRLIVVLIKARNIHSDRSNDLLGKDLSVKVSLRHGSKKLKKKQSKRAKHKINPVWNEMIMFEVPPELLGEVSVDLEMIYLEPTGQKTRANGPSHILGTFSLGLDRTGMGKSHWQEMMSNPRRQIAMWHNLHP